MKKREGLFQEKVCVTASSQDYAHRAPVSFSVRKGVAIVLAVVLVCVLGLCAYTTVNARFALNELKGTNEALEQTVEMQINALKQYEQTIGKMQRTQQAAEPGSG
jgi:hypothetical protein